MSLPLALENLGQVTHFNPLFRIEGDTDSAAEGLYDKMRLVGAH